MGIVAWAGILPKIFTVPLSWESLLSFVPLILRFGLLLLSWNSWMFLVRSLLHFVFSLSVVSMFSMVASAAETLFYLCVLLVMLASMSPVLFPRFSISRVVFLCDFFIVQFPFLILDGFAQFLHPFVCVFLYFLVGFLCFLIKGFYLFTCIPLYFFNGVFLWPS